MTNQQAQLEATRDLLRELVEQAIRVKGVTKKGIAAEIGEEYTGFVHRLAGRRETYRNLDTSFVLNILAVLNVPMAKFYKDVSVLANQRGDGNTAEYLTRVAERASALPRKTPGRH